MRKKEEIMKDIDNLRASIADTSLKVKIDDMERTNMSTGDKMLALDMLKKELDELQNGGAHSYWYPAKRRGFDG